MKSLFSVPEKNNLIKEVGLQEECASFEYHWGYITQLDSYLEGQLSLRIYQDQRDHIYSCPGFDPCPPRNPSADYLRKQFRND